MPNIIRLTSFNVKSALKKPLSSLLNLKNSEATRIGYQAKAEPTRLAVATILICSTILRIAMLNISIIKEANPTTVVTPQICLTIFFAKIKKKTIKSIEKKVSEVPTSLKSLSLYSAAVKSIGIKYKTIAIIANKSPFALFVYAFPFTVKSRSYTLSAVVSEVVVSLNALTTASSPSAAFNFLFSSSKELTTSAVGDSDKR